ncbi:wall-associated receptor kinase-like 8 [Rosa chinensis]|uniref:wall-associated receptor kinase-like 8 n=1 Tax=Rosa chinensis TaxID=74649 RepID=UPI000D08FB87|nr:wall-associated receptor kinase-like 8 [Rosa chinensis]
MSRSQFQFLVLHFTSLFILWAMSSRTTLAAASPVPPTDSIAKLHCPSHCGHIAIPYPFGIGEGCYLTGSDTGFYSNSFQIICNYSTSPPKPFLTSTSLEVLEISIEGTLQVRSPITFSNCTDKPGLPSNRQTYNLEQTPFWYSQDNRFTSMSCGGIALMTKFSNGLTTTLGGCLSICDYSSNPVLKKNTCIGINCCQSTFPKYLKNFNASFADVINARSAKECKYAFVVKQSWFTRTNMSVIGDMDYVPVELKWSARPYSDISNNWTVSNNSTYISDDGRLLLCSKGYEGNPYLLHGCQDINECEGRPCVSYGICINYPGGFKCDPPPTSLRPEKLVVIVTSSVFGVLLILICGWWSHKVIKKRKNIKRKKKFFKQNGGFLLEQQFSSGEVNVEKIKLFNSKELEKATDHFNVDRILGQGGQGTVYKGMLADGRIVAVKKSKLVHGGEVRQFINEIVILSQIIHRNVVKLLGCCLETEVPLLVYEFIANGTLSDYIHQQNEEFPLTWEIRLRVAIEVARALSYLHSAAAFPIYHRDIKSSNILLDDKYRAKVADFGTSRSISIDQTHLTTLVYGTFGYLDPEYFQSSQFTDKSDVYSFGVVLAELLTGQKPVSFTRSQEERSLATYFLLSMDQDCLFDVLDPQVTRYGGKEEITAVANLAKRCLNLNGRRRPTMKEVAVELEAIQSSIKASNHVDQNLEEVAYIQTHEITEAWDIVSTSTGPCIDGGRSSFDAQPLLTLKTL